MGFFAMFRMTHKKRPKMERFFLTPLLKGWGGFGMIYLE